MTFPRGKQWKGIFFFILRPASDLLVQVDLRGRVVLPKETMVTSLRPHTQGI